MESHQVRTNPSSNSSLGFCLLPSELIQNILLTLALPDIKSLARVNKCLSSVVSDGNFVREFNARSRSASWLFFCKKRWPQDAMLHGYTRQVGRWLTIPITKWLKPAIFPGEDLYFLTSDGNVFLFASNTQRALIAADLVSRRVKKIPASPLGPRGTSSWRRYGMKLVAGPPGSGHFRFMFVELVGNTPTLFLYGSETDTWRSTEAEEEDSGGLGGGEDDVFLNLINGPQQNTLIAVGSEAPERPVIVRPIFAAGRNGGPPLVAVGSGRVHQLHVCGDGYVMIVRSGDADRGGLRIVGSIELWGLSTGRNRWDLASIVPDNLVEKMKKPHGALMGCVEARDGTVRAALVSTFEGQWEIICLSYRVSDRSWTSVPVPDCRMKGSNMAGISFSSGLTIA